MYVSDQDSASSQAVQRAKEACGEDRPSEWQYCSQHLLKGSHRLVSRTLNLKSAACSQTSASPVDPNLPFQCLKCEKGFRSSAGRATHTRFCRASGGKDATNKTQSWSELNGISAKELKPFKRKLLHWLMVRKNAELRRGVATWKRFKLYRGKADLELKHRLKQAAGTILTCLSGDHANCLRYSFVCCDSKDPFLFLLPFKRPVSSLSDSIKRTLSESIWSVFQSEKLDRLLVGGTLRTTSLVESTHRTIRAPAPKGKPLRKNQSAVLRAGATIAASRGRGVANLNHFRALGLSVSSTLARKMLRMDENRRKTAQRRRRAETKEKALATRRQKLEAHGKSLNSVEVTQYRKEAFSQQDHSYARTSSIEGEFKCCFYRCLFYNG